MTSNKQSLMYRNDDVIPPQNDDEIPIALYRLALRSIRMVTELRLAMYHIVLPQITFKLSIYRSKFTVVDGSRVALTEAQQRQDLQLLNHPVVNKAPTISDLEWYVKWLPEQCRHFRLFAGQQQEPFSGKQLPTFILREFIDFAVICTKDILDSVRKADQHDLLSMNETLHLTTFWVDVNDQCQDICMLYMKQNYSVPQHVVSKALQQKLQQRIDGQPVTNSVEQDDTEDNNSDNESAQSSIAAVEESKATSQPNDNNERDAMVQDPKIKQLICEIAVIMSYSDDDQTQCKRTILILKEALILSIKSVKSKYNYSQQVDHTQSNKLFDEIIQQIEKNASNATFMKYIKNFVALITCSVRNCQKVSMKLIGVHKSKCLACKSNAQQQFRCNGCYTARIPNCVNKCKHSEEAVDFSDDVQKVLHVATAFALLDVLVDIFSKQHQKDVNHKNIESMFTSSQYRLKSMMKNFYTQYIDLKDLQVAKDSFYSGSTEGPILMILQGKEILKKTMQLPRDKVREITETSYEKCMDKSMQLISQKGKAIIHVKEQMEKVATTISKLPSFKLIIKEEEAQVQQLLEMIAFFQKIHTVVQSIISQLYPLEAQVKGLDDLGKYLLLMLSKAEGLTTKMNQGTNNIEPQPWFEEIQKSLYNNFRQGDVAFCKTFENRQYKFCFGQQREEAYYYLSFNGLTQMKNLGPKLQKLFYNMLSKYGMQDIISPEKDQVLLLKQLLNTVQGLSNGATNSQNVPYLDNAQVTYCTVENMLAGTWLQIVQSLITNKNLVAFLIQANYEDDQGVKKSFCVGAQFFDRNFLPSTGRCVIQGFVNSQQCESKLFYKDDLLLTVKAVMSAYCEFSQPQEQKMGHVFVTQRQTDNIDYQKRSYIVISVVNQNEAWGYIAEPEFLKSCHQCQLQNFGGSAHACGSTTEQMNTLTTKTSVVKKFHYNMTDPTQVEQIAYTANLDLDKSEEEATANQSQFTANVMDAIYQSQQNKVTKSTHTQQTFNKKPTPVPTPALFTFHRDASENNQMGGNKRTQKQDDKSQKSRHSKKGSYSDNDNVAPPLESLSSHQQFQKMVQTPRKPNTQKTNKKTAQFHVHNKQKNAKSVASQDIDQQLMNCQNSDRDDDFRAQSEYHRLHPNQKNVWHDHQQ